MDCRAVLAGKEVFSSHDEAVGSGCRSQFNTGGPRLKGRPLTMTALSLGAIRSASS